MSCAPLDVVNKLAEKYPDCWQLAEMFREGKRDGDLEWDERCYLPITGGLLIAMQGIAEISEMKNVPVDAAAIAAVTPWRIHKQIFTFQEDVEALLYEQANDLIIPIEILNNMPYQCIYIETTLIEDIDGFFVHFESDTNDGQLELRLLIVSSDLQLFPIPIHLTEGNTIKDGIDQMIAESKNVKARVENQLSLNFQKEVGEESVQIVPIVDKLLQLVLYICAENSEIAEDAVQSKITQIPTSLDLIKDKFKEVQKWHCGEKTGNIIKGLYSKTTYSYNEQPNKGTGSLKRPHSRRAHWHHYWKESEANNDRRLELKWIAPSFVYAEELDDNIVKINKVKDNKQGE